MSRSSDGALRRAVILGVVAPVVIGLAAVAIQLAVLGDLPDPVATHWGPSGVDGFAPAWTVPLFSALLIVGLPLLLSAMTIPSLRHGERGFVLRFLVAAALFLSILMAVILTGSLLIQRGLADAADAPSILPVMGVGLAAAVGAGLGAWVLQPRHAEIRPEVHPAVALERGAGERAAWFGRAEMTAWPLAMLIGAAVLLAAMTIGMALLGDPTATWILLGVTVLIAVLVSTLTVFRVRVDPTGLTVRSAAGLVRMRVPVEDVEAVATTEVRGLAQYGGFGVRMVPGATAVVLRSGPALEVTRVGGRRFVVTMDDAETAAAVLAAVVEDARADQG